MKTVIIIVTILVLGGCTSMQPVEMQPVQLQKELVAGDIVGIGETVRLVTADGKEHKFKVISIAKDRISGKDTDILIKDIVAVETREFSAGKSAVLATGTAAALTYLLQGVAAAAILGGGGL